MENPYFSRIMDAVDMMVADQRQKQAENRQIQMMGVEAERGQKKEASGRKFSLLSSLYADKTAGPEMKKQALGGLIGMVNNPDMEMPDIQPQYESDYVDLPEEIKTKYPMLADPNVKWKKDELLQIQKLIQEKEGKAATLGETSRHNTALERARSKEVSLKDTKGTGTKPEKDVSLARVKKLRDEAYDAYKSGNLYGYGEDVSKELIFEYIGQADELIRKAEDGVISPQEQAELKGLESVLTKGYKKKQRKQEAEGMVGELKTVLEEILKAKK